MVEAVSEAMKLRQVLGVVRAADEVGSETKRIKLEPYATGSTAHKMKKIFFFPNLSLLSLFRTRRCCWASISQHKVEGPEYGHSSVEGK